MGLIKAAVGAVGSTLHDQWKEYIRCDDLGQDILMKRVSTPNGIISKDSGIQVAPGQIAVIFQNGQILDATAEEGIYTFDQSTSPSFFAGQFGAVLKKCGLDLHIMVELLKNRQYFILMLKKLWIISLVLLLLFHFKIGLIYSKSNDWNDESITS